ncbi:hypothetical protein HETIRDRAFT_162619 [Heterobasidion irregulare TC 32-1]|uniref:Uncharacterized protein n=1 Tax=Heterobasidion irregulare (strain TC 32-1) TaxID=747525 RepID=W4JQN4_HETIT|nr:uncharacterized protein HETIRDRAFT_162619 [Heterobasidion irregulare TC 32-1]ETW75843.1 hypothetical protein HETIRDRAFT_162619 [Heterobasidion irregulare TC 32-1]
MHPSSRMEVFQRARMPISTQVIMARRTRNLSNACLASPGFTLFYLIRYISIATLLISNIGFFSNFTPSTCQKYYMAAPILKVFQIMVSQSILGARYGVYPILLRRRSSKICLGHIIFLVGIAGLDGL